MSSGVPMELLEVEPQLGSSTEPTHTSVPTPYDKRLMVFAGRGSQAGRLCQPEPPGSRDEEITTRMSASAGLGLKTLPPIGIIDIVSRPPATIPKRKTNSYSRA